MGLSPPASPFPCVPPYGDSKEADPETTVQKWMLSYPKLDAPLDWVHEQLETTSRGCARLWYQLHSNGSALNLILYIVSLPARSPLTFKPASLKLSTGAAATPADVDEDTEDYFRIDAFDGLPVLLCLIGSFSLRLYTKNALQCLTLELALAAVSLVLVTMIVYCPTYHLQLEVLSGVTVVSVRGII
eukprot:1155929-Pelagomonas_calceolata.AAC.2